MCYNSKHTINIEASHYVDLKKWLLKKKDLNYIIHKRQKETLKMEYERERKREHKIQRQN